LLARRVIANEALARQRGVDLNNQTLISQRVIEEMQDGVLVLGRDGRVRQSNPRARQAAGPANGGQRGLVGRVFARTGAGFRRLVSERARGGAGAGAGEWHAVARAVRRYREHGKRCAGFSRGHEPPAEQAQQIKLAALGRLTANIAHEIRNPLSAISHAGELLREERRGELYERLLRIVLDNTQRLERIVSDVLELGAAIALSRTDRPASCCRSSRVSGQGTACRPMWWPGVVGRGHPLFRSFAFSSGVVEPAEQRAAAFAARCRQRSPAGL
jgi:two-component system sensor histidine kinase PilS (NtrC family)